MSIAQDVRRRSTVGFAAHAKGAGASTTHGSVTAAGEEFKLLASMGPVVPAYWEVLREDPSFRYVKRMLEKAQPSRAAATEKLASKSIVYPESITTSFQTTLNRCGGMLANECGRDVIENQCIDDLTTVLTEEDEQVSWIGMVDRWPSAAGIGS